MTDLITKDHNAIGIDKGDTPLLASHLIAGIAETGRNQTLMIKRDMQVTAGCSRVEY